MPDKCPECGGLVKSVRYRMVPMAHVWCVGFVDPRFPYYPLGRCGWSGYYPTVEA